MIKTDSVHAPRLLARTSSAAILLGALLAGTTQCGSDDQRPTSLVGSSGGHDADGGRSASAGTANGGAQDLAGAAGQSTGDGGTNTGGSPDEEAAGGPPIFPPATCALNATWSSPLPVAGLAGSANDSLLSLTPDELNLALLRGDVLYVAHRDRVSAAFELGSPIAVPVGWTAAQGAALSADGKRLILVSDPDQNRLGELSRTSRTATFSGAVDVSSFVDLNQDAEFTGRVYASPTLSQTDDRLFFNSALQQTSTVVVSSRTADGWSRPKRLVTSVLDSSDGKRRLPTGVSSDARTLFYFNEESAAQEARWRTSTLDDTPLYDIQSLGKRRGASANFACDRLYSASSSGLVMERN
jgi:hypothetical protein